MNVFSIISFSILFFCVDAAGPQERQIGEDAEAGDDLVKQQKIMINLASQITKEAETLGNGHWAGRYTNGGSGPEGKRPRQELFISPKSGFILFDHCQEVPEVTFLGYGAVHQKKDSIVLDFTFQHERPPSTIDGGLLHPIRWGKRNYLIGEKDLLKFCNLVNSGEEAHNNACAYFFVRDGKRLEVDGLPSVPDKYRQYLLPRPLEAKVINIEEPPDSAQSKDVSPWPAMTIDIGEKDGLRKGMHLYIRDIDYYVSRVVVSELHDNKCQVRFSPFKVLELPIPKPKIGWRISSLSKIGEMQVK